MPASEQRKELTGMQKENRTKRVKKAHFVIKQAMCAEKVRQKSKKNSGKPRRHYIPDYTLHTHKKIPPKANFQREFTILSGARCGT